MIETREKAIVNKSFYLEVTLIILHERNEILIKKFRISFPFKVCALSLSHFIYALKKMPLRNLLNVELNMHNFER